MASISANQEFWQAGVSSVGEGGEGLSAAQQLTEGVLGEGGAVISFGRCCEWAMSG